MVMRWEPIVGEKMCSRCGQFKPVTEYKPQRGMCNPCLREYDSERRKAVRAGVRYFPRDPLNAVAARWRYPAEPARLVWRV